MIGKDFSKCWNSFWFAPSAATTLAMIRIATGAMLAYIHVVWCLRLEDFFGPNAFTTGEFAQNLHRGDYAWSYLWFIDSIPILWAHHLVAIAFSILMSIGLFTRFVIPVIWFMTLMVCHRMTGLLFGLDQIVMMVTMYLMVARSGDEISVDRYLHLRNAQATPGLNANAQASNVSIYNTIAARLMQIHLCVIYLFGGLGKMRGETWWDGSAIWLSAVSYEYQSLDLTWIGNFPVLMALAAHVTLFWETFYVCLVWPKMTRPWVLAIAMVVHAGIGVFLGMITFGWMMIVANAVFIEPTTMQRWLGVFNVKPGVSHTKLQESGRP
jgi:hypothetical protein